MAAARPHWREAASLLVARKRNLFNGHKGSSQFDYQVLMAQRSSRSAFMPNACVFPGGVFSAKADFDPR